MTAVMELPSTREESWRWGDPAAIVAAAELPRGAALDADALFLDLPGARAVFVDGVLDAARSDLRHVELVQVDGGAHVLGRRTTGTGWSIRVAGDTAAELLQIVHIATGGENHLPAEIVLAEGATASVVETYVGTGWSNRSTRTTLGSGAKLTRAVRLLQTAGFVSVRDEVDIHAGASLIATVLGAGDAGTRIDGAIIVSGDDAFAEYGGALLTRNDQRQECAVSVRHAALNGQSKQIWRAVAADTSTASLAARVEVARDAQKTDGVQSLRGLLLKRTATVNLKPELEIFADDVKCAHGATVGELDQRALFYMQSRGIPHAKAQALLTRAFVGDAFAQIADETVRDAFVADADAWLEAAL
ncbi:MULTISPECIES: SufB/SufD family protein [unclassified Sphingomonas]|uniref:SufB/SufD family protein n=1 Tax=unclassified Sphingomonas TaxID=196159 RepID=UPI0006F2D767|nr:MULTISPECIES: SufD family Fe-S cluster assembly protein [unclassified Sphingomonas]KQN28256.1 SufBD protein [Sphingomonas sp. Leaf34]KQN29761.1 SufBD protein [Sphingomonas sp. Leaf38]